MVPTQIHQNPACPTCACKLTVKKGVRRNRLQTLQVFRCTECLHRFTGPAGKHKTYPLHIILESVTPDRGDGKPAYAFEAGSTQTCTKEDPFISDCTNATPPRPRLGVARFAFSNGSVNIVPPGPTFIDLGPKYHATYNSKSPDASNCSSCPDLTMTAGTTSSQQLIASFRNLGTRTWFKAVPDPDNTQVLLGILDARTGEPATSTPFHFSSGDPLHPAILTEGSVAPGAIGTFSFTLSAPASTKTGIYILRVTRLLRIRRAQRRSL